MTKEKFKAEVSLPSDTEVRVTRSFHAPRKLVWQAHTDPKLFTRWIGGYPGWEMTACEMDVRPGGKYRWRWRNDSEKQEFGFLGEFREVEAPALMVQEEYFDPGTMGGAMDESKPSINRLTFTEKGGVTTLETVIKYASKDIRDQALSTGMTDGMEVSFGRLDALCASEQEA